tara:strand:+ start:3749 stop:4762 length:1014 start_codon:yes stop_codon:yes gene_type:complete
MIVDVVVGLQHGDEAKGKITHQLCKNYDYDYVLRFNGGGNAGHTIYHHGKKFITHYIPAGVFHGIKSIIGNGCVINPKHLMEEMRDLAYAGIDTKNLVRIASNCHVITDEHLEEDGRDTRIGTTKRGTGPAYRDKYSRDGLRAKDVPELEDYVIDLYETLHKDRDTKILCEGAQGFELDIDWGDYPYVTSSHTTVASALLNGIPPQAIRNVWGVAKVYDTYVGTKNFEPEGVAFPRLRDIGEEYGATTGRPRQCNWLNLDSLIKSLAINGVTQVVFNKTDVLQELGEFKLIYNNKVQEFSSLKQMCDYIEVRIPSPVRARIKRILYSGDKHGMDIAA